MSDPSSILQTIARLRRAMPRNQDVLVVCAELERRLVTIRDDTQVPKFDRTAYQREYMRKRRAAARKARRAEEQKP